MVANGAHEHVATGGQGDVEFRESSREHSGSCGEDRSSGGATTNGQVVLVLARVLHLKMQAITRSRKAARVKAVLVRIHEYIRRGGRGEGEHDTDLIGVHAVVAFTRSSLMALSV